jgi:hypothetical protein
MSCLKARCVPLKRRLIRSTFRGRLGSTAGTIAHRVRDFPRHRPAGVTCAAGLRAVRPSAAKTPRPRARHAPCSVVLHDRARLAAARICKGALCSREFSAPSI